MELNKAFCVVPWLHLHVMPDSTVIPCCVSPYDDVYGDVSKSSVEEIWNNEKFKKIRSQMLAGEMPPGCRHCHDLEKASFTSMRMRMNDRFRDYIPEFDASTTPDGEYKELRLRYIDIRFSNLCNFKCRGCGPSLSSAWYDDHQKLFNFKSDAPKLKSISEDSPDFWKRFKELVNDAQVIYFGGGEPLITKEHFDLIRLLIERKRTDIELNYNTNLSTLTYGNHNLLDLWSKFRSVILGLSIDDWGKRAEYFRSGTNWDNIVKNLIILRDNYQGIYRYVNCTVNLSNVYYLPELFDYLVGGKFINPDSFHINLLLDPEEYRIDVLPKLVKEKIKLKLEKHVANLSKNGMVKAAGDFNNIINHMMERDNSHLLPKFFDRTSRLDSIRSESFAEVYPELLELFDE